MNKTTLFIATLFSASAFNMVDAAQHSHGIASAQLWQPSTLASKTQLTNINSKAISSQRLSLDIDAFSQTLLSHQSLLVDLPLPDGSFVTYRLEKSNVMHPELGAKYPQVRTFNGYQLDQPSHTGTFDISPQGFHGVFKSATQQVFIDPLSQNSNRDYHSYYRDQALPLADNARVKRLPPRKSANQIDNLRQHKASPSLAKVNDNTLTTYRIAVATTGEYASFHGGTKAQTLAALVTMLNRVNDVYQRDLSITFELVAANDSIIYTDASSDPFDNTDADIDLTSNIINSAIGVENYDIGHLVGTGGGGLAGFQVVCSEAKAEGITGSASPTADAFYIDYVAHEIGHQFGADHTFNGALEACDGNRESSSAYEPGSASTIMGYAGICSGQNLQNSSDPFFHIHSIDQIRAFTAPLENCGSSSTLSNNAPTVDAGQDYTIPARTPFTLVGSASDPENDSLSYSWEQFDLGGQSNDANDDKTDDGTRPLFRAFAPLDIGSRTFPRLADILANRQTHGEALPTTTRALNFRLVVRDNNNNLVDDAVKLNVIAAEQGFSVNPISQWHGAEQTVTWHTASTEQAPVSCPQVDILLSVDSGLNFSQVLADNTANDGSAEVVLPNVTSDTARVKIVCSNNIFFAINNADFQIISEGGAPSKPIFASQVALSVNEDSTMTLAASALSFENNQAVDSIEVQAGENYSFAGGQVTPNANFNGSLTVNVTATIADLVSDVFVVTITVNPVNDLPIAVADSATVQQDSSANEIDVLANDSDIDADVLTLQSLDYSGSGSVAIVNNRIHYTPVSGFSGSDSISYTINDSAQGTSTSQVTITVTAIAEPPVVEPTKKSSSGGSIYYLLSLLLLTFGRKFIQGERHE